MKLHTWMLALIPALWTGAVATGAERAPSTASVAAASEMLTPYCYANYGQGYGDHWWYNGQEYSKDSPDLTDDSICLVDHGEPPPPPLPPLPPPPPPLPPLPPPPPPPPPFPGH